MKYIACICEGGAERAILDLLLDNHKLKFEHEDLIEEEVLRCRRLYMVNEFLYDMLWNEKEQKACNGQQITKEKMTATLKQCLMFSHFCKRSFNEKFYCEKLYQST